MSLFGSIQLAGNTLQAMDIALQVVGQNISNAETPGYIREKAVLKANPTQQYGGMLLGTGVSINGVVQVIDKYLEERLRNAGSDSANAAALQANYSQLESTIGALDGTNDLNTVMTAFFNGISNILNSPADVTVRSQTVMNGQLLADNISLLHQKVTTLRSDANSEIAGMAENINQLTATIAQLNYQIAQVQTGVSANSDAVGLADQRLQALSELSDLVNISTIRQNDGTINVYCGGASLVTEKFSRSVKAVTDAGNTSNAVKLCFTDTGTELTPTSGRLRGLIDSRDAVLGGFINQLDDFAKTLIYEFNKVYSSGQGLTGYNTLTSEYAVDDATTALNDTGLTYTPESGSFQVLTTDTQTGITKTTTINVDLDSAGHRTTLADINDALNAISGVTSEITSTGKLKIKAGTATVISFANDTSATLAALGLNVFFIGTGAGDVGVSDIVANDPGKFAASQGGIGADTDNAQILASFINQPLAAHDNQSVSDIYKDMIAKVGDSSSKTAANAAACTAFQSTLQSQESAVSGVNLDEEAVNMLLFQKSYQASAKYISTLTSLLDALMAI
jgi:flagellar hook-associated protein 1